VYSVTFVLIPTTLIQGKASSIYRFKVGDLLTHEARLEASEDTFVRVILTYHNFD